MMMMTHEKYITIMNPRILGPGVDLEMTRRRHHLVVNDSRKNRGFIFRLPTAAVVKTAKIALALSLVDYGMYDFWTLPSVACFVFVSLYPIYWYLYPRDTILGRYRNQAQTKHKARRQRQNGRLSPHHSSRQYKRVSQPSRQKQRRWQQ